jgi:hypothetical protein
MINLRRKQLEQSKRGKRAASTIIGSIIVLSIVLTVGYGFFFSEIQDQQALLNTSLKNNSNAAQQAQENLLVTGKLIGSALGFVVNNTGISATILSYVITDRSNGQITQFNSGTSSSPSLPYAIGQGQGVTFNTGILYTSGKSYAIDLLTARGSSFLGTYPSRQIGVQVASALIASGFGSVAMVFSSYTLYSYSHQGGPWIVNLAQPHPGGLIPSGIYPVFSIQITNNDPNIGTITIDSHTDIYLYNTCTSGCGGNLPLFAYYAVNLAANGTITSTGKGSFAPISVPYGVTTTIYFASNIDLSLGTFSTTAMQAGTKVNLGEYDVFVIISGSDASSQNSIIYSQNLPFAGSYLADNVAWLSETPTSCTHSSLTTFSLTITNSQWSKGSVQIVNESTSSFTLVVPNQYPGKWIGTVSSGVITWTAKTGGSPIGPGSSFTFSWSGVAPATIGTQEVFLITLSFTSGTVIAQQSAAGCFVS